MYNNYPRLENPNQNSNVRRVFRGVNYSLPVNRQFKKLLFALVLLLSVCTHAQVNKYSFLITGATYTPITGGNTMNVSDPALQITGIGFNFYFDGHWYDAVSISDTGAIYFMDWGIPVIDPDWEGGDAISDYSNGAGAIAPFSCELTGGANREVRYVTTGTAPNRVFAVQWKNFARQGAGSESIEFQARLYESTNKIEFAYGNWTNPTVMTGSGPRGGQVGLRGRNHPSFKNMRVLPGGAWNAATSGAFSNALCHYDGDTPATKPSSTLRYIFSPCDLSVSIAPLAMGCAPTQMTVQVVNSGAAAYNFGAHPIAVSATVYPVTQNLTTDLTSGILDPGETMNVTFNAGFPAGLYYTLSAAISPVYDDYNTSNNNTVLSQYVGHYPVPYTVTQPCTASMSDTGTISISGDVTPSVGNLGANDELRLNCKTAFHNWTSSYFTPTFDIQVSTNCGSSYTTIYANVAAPTINEYSPNEANMRFSLAAYAGQKIMVRLVPKVGVTYYNISFNNIRFAPAAPPCVTNMLPASGATVQGTIASLSWIPSAGATSYDVYIGTTATNLTLTGNASQASYIANLAPLTQYFWRVVPKNASTFADDCTTINSFTTTSATIDLAVTEINVPNICPHVGNVIVTVQNAGVYAVDLSTQNATITINKPAPTPQTLTGILNTGTLQPGETRQITIPGGNFTASGTYNVAASVSVAGDTFAGNNTATFAKTIDAYQPVPVNVGNISMTSSNSAGRVYTTSVTGVISVGDHFTFNLSTKPSSSNFPFTDEMYIEVNTSCDDEYFNYQYVTSAPFVVGTNSSNWSAAVPVDIDLSPWAGQYVKVRVIMPDTYYPDNGWLTEYHEARLMNTRFYNTPKCATGTIPANGTVFLTDQTIYQSAVLSWNAVPTAIMYEVFLGTTPNPPSVGFTELTSHSPGQLLPGTQYYWKVLARNNDAAATSCEIQTFTTGYCTPRYYLGTQGDRQISNVQLGTLNNPSNGAQSSPFHTFYTNVTVPNIAQGQPAPLTVQMGSSANQYVGAWIDFNRNKIFDPSEGVFSTVPTVPYGGPVLLVFTVPANAVLGQTVMRVRNGINWQIPLSASCGELTGSAYGETEDYYVNITPSTVYPQCATLQSPANGATDVARNGNSVLLSWAAPTNGLAVASYDVYAGTTEANMVLKGNATTTSFNLANLFHGVQYYWKAVPKTSSGSAAAGCSVLSFTTKNPFAPYCSNIVYQYYTEPISRVTFAGINNASSNAILPSPNGYEIEDFTAITGNVTHGQTYALTIKANTSLSALSNFNVYIDWNQNGNFNDAGEIYNAGYIEGSTGADAYGTTINISIPYTAVLGTTRMRVHKHFSPSANACSASSTAGQMEDYSLNVNPVYTDCVTLLSPQNNASIPTPSGGSVTLSWQPATTGPGATSYSLYLGSSPTEMWLEGTHTQTSVTLGPFDGGQYAYYWKVVPHSAAGTDSENCAVSFFQVQNEYYPYCGNLLFYSGTYPITKVNFAGIDNITDSNINYATDQQNFISITGNVTKGSTYPMTLKGHTRSGSSFNFYVYIDWNQDGDFSDTGETINAGTVVNSTGFDAIQTLTNIAIPNNAMTGNTRMRIKFTSAGDNNPCSNTLGYGQYEDYTLNVSNCVPTNWYADTDHDGFGNPAVSVLACLQPAGHVSNNTDCNDANQNINQTYPFYADTDGDAYGSGNLVQVCAFNAITPPSGFVTNDYDCNEGNSTVYLNTPLYIDADGDNYNVGQQNMCIGLTAPAGFSATTLGIDCNDNSSVVWRNAVLYVDVDGDGYSTGQQSVCYGATVPQDFNAISLGPDCNDGNATMHQTFPFYTDWDADGYGFGNLTPVCAVNATTPPANYSLNNLDCNDSKNTIHPGVDEVGYNLIDDNCDGVTDEGFTPVVAVIQNVLCNTILPAIDSQITANIISNAQGYRWKVTTMSGPSAGQIQILDTNLRVMKLTQLVNYAFNTQYKIDISVRYAGFWQPFTTSGCTVTTPAASTTLTTCGQTLSGMANVIFANLVPYATGYRFRITDPMNPSNVQTIERNVREFRMNLITGFQIQYGKQYNVAVSVKNTDGSWLPFGSVCTVTTPAFPTTSLQESQCSDYLVQTGNTQLYAIAYPGAIAYVFQLSGGGLSVPAEITKNTRTFKLNDFAAQLLAGATYNVKVRMVFDQTDLPGPFGKACTITIPAVSKQNAAAFDAVFNAVAYPNPFADSFNIDVTTASSESISVKVYDAIGRLLDTKQMKPGAEISNIGSHFPSGVYNLVVTQGDNVKTLRVVKR